MHHGDGHRLYSRRRWKKYPSPAGVSVVPSLDRQESEVRARRRRRPGVPSVEGAPSHVITLAVPPDIPRWGTEAVLTSTLTTIFRSRRMGVKGQGAPQGVTSFVARSPRGIALPWAGVVDWCRVACLPPPQ